MTAKTLLKISIQGMDCQECARIVERAIAAVPGVRSVAVSLAAEKAEISSADVPPDLRAIRRAIEAAGYAVGDQAGTGAGRARSDDLSRQILTLLGILFGVVLLVVIAGEWLGLIEAVTDRVPLPIGVIVVILGGYPIFQKVIRVALHGQILSHTLMTVGAVAALAVGEWATAVVVVLFMHIGDYVERFTSQRARGSVKRLIDLAPRTARVNRQGIEVQVPIDQVRVGETVVVRPGERIPVDGVVTDGQATIDQATITGESMPVEISAGDAVFATTISQLGSLHIRVVRLGEDTTFGRIIKLVEEAETNRAQVERLADRFSRYYLPFVAGIAALTLFFSRDALATAAVLVVACSCSFAMATPIAMLASIGAAAKRGLLIKGGRFLEILAKADVLLIDKTGTLTLGRPEITDILSFDNLSPNKLLQLAASVERFSEHPLAEAVLDAARERNLPLDAVENFTAVPGRGVHATLHGSAIAVGSARMVGIEQLPPEAETLAQAGKSVLFVVRERKVVGALAAEDTLRPSIRESLDAIATLGIKKIELLTGDHAQVAARVAESLSIAFRAELLPEDKLEIVRAYQRAGQRVVMIGDGVNDAPALAQADVGIAMGAAGSDVAIEAAHIALMGDDWAMLPHLFQIARRTMRVVSLNIAFTTVYNLVGISLAAFGFLPPILAAAAQSFPDLGILANSSRLLRQKR